MAAVQTVRAGALVGACAPMDPKREKAVAVMCTEHEWNKWQASPCVTCTNLAIFKPLWREEEAKADRSAATSAAVMGRMMQPAHDRRRRAMIASEASRIARSAREARTP